MSARRWSPRSVLPTAPPRGHVIRWMCTGGLLLAAAGCQALTNPAAQVELQESLYQLQDLLVEMREEIATLQWQVDSLQGVVARQDTSLRRVANQLGMPLPP
jgi:hypothetical protein